MPPVADQVTAVFAALVTVAVNWRVAPVATDADVGEIVTETTVPVLTVTVAVAVAEPPEFVAVSVYVVVAVGVREIELPVTDPTPGAILNVFAPVTDQLRVML